MTATETFKLAIPRPPLSGLGGFLDVPRVWTGLWQLSSPAWGTAPAARIRREMRKHVDKGFVAFADHYGSAEQLFGHFRSTLPQSTSARVLGATKWCVFRAPPQGDLSPSYVEEAIRERIKRMRGSLDQGGSGRVDLLQFYWQDYSDKRYLQAIHIMASLRSTETYYTPIGGVGLVNFDSARVDEICTSVGKGVVLTNQVQFSLIDIRPLYGMADVCKRHGVKLLTYGTLCGGFLSDKWLYAPEPNRYNEEPTMHDPLTPSQKKYLDVILSAWGTWALFQQLLIVLRRIGDYHGGVSIANVATRWVLDHDFVGAVIIGARLGVSDNTDDNRAVFGWRLTKEDHAMINSVLQKSEGAELINTIGDCGAEYR
ncbi:Aldo/keto reductase [Serendipita vermifera]|nr:Aldo/keto reductase [Serendipita vermifera]